VFGATRRPPAATGPVSRLRGRRGSTTASPSSSACGAGSPSASAAVASRSTAAGWPTLAIVPGASVLARVIGSVIGRWADWPA